MTPRLPEDVLLALHAHLLRPDPPSLRRRGHRLTHVGDPRRREQHRAALLVRWSVQRDLAVDGDFPVGRVRRRMLFARTA